MKMFSCFTLSGKIIEERIIDMINHLTLQSYAVVTSINRLKRSAFFRQNVPPRPLRVYLQLPTKDSNYSH
jgi:hypothetical protein